MAYCMYLRKSRADMEAEQRGDGETLARHERALLDLAARMSIPIPPESIYRELVSGDTIAERPVVQQLLREVESNAWDGVFVMDIDRIARGETIDQGIVAQAFKYSATHIITPLKTYDPSSDMDEEFVEFALFMARREYKLIKRRMQGGRLRSASEGHYLGPRPPYGYQRIHERGGRGWTLSIVPEKAAIVRAVFSWYAHGMDGSPAGAQRIANRLNRIGVKTDLGNPFDAARVRAMLKNPTYAGFIRWNQRVTRVSVLDGERHKARLRTAEPMCVPGLHEPIIDKALWDAVRRRFDERGARPVRGAGPLVNPLAGIVRCGHCGRAMVRKPGGRGRPDLLRCPGPGCAMPGTSLSAVESAIVDALNRWLGGFNPDKPYAPEPPDPIQSAQSAARQQLTAELATLRAQQARLHDLLERGIYTEAVFADRSSTIAARIADAEAHLCAPDEPDPPARPAPIRSQTLIEAYESSDPARRNALLRAAFERVVYAKSKACKRGENPAAFIELDIYPRLPQPMLPSPDER